MRTATVIAMPERQPTPARAAPQVADTVILAPTVIQEDWLFLHPEDDVSTSDVVWSTAAFLVIAGAVVSWLI